MSELLCFIIGHKPQVIYKYDEAQGIQCARCGEIIL